MNVSLVFTVLSEGETIGGLLAAIDSQTMQPDEIVVTDGGSTDGTLERLRDWAAGRASVVVGSSAGANIAIGRNLAIERAAGPIIAVTDAGCVPDANWLEELVKPFEDGVDVVMGCYTAEATTRFERIISCLNIPDPKEINPEKYMPSARSLAFTKNVWTAVGGFPEWLNIGEDMFFNHTLKAIKAKRRFAPRAIVKWRPRPTLKLSLRSYFYYARGDAIGGMYIRRHAIRFFSYSAMAGLVGFWLVAPVFALVPIGLELFWLLPAYKRAGTRLAPADFARALVVLPVLQVMVDFAKMTGYLSGLFRR
ncbi:MAG: glycosyltransferase [Actinomycetota bacterium]